MQLGNVYHWLAQTSHQGTVAQSRPGRVNNKEKWLVRLWGWRSWEHSSVVSRPVLVFSSLTPKYCNVNWGKRNYVMHVENVRFFQVPFRRFRRVLNLVWSGTWRQIKDAPSAWAGLEKEKADHTNKNVRKKEYSDNGEEYIYVWFWYQLLFSFPFHPKKIL